MILLKDMIHNNDQVQSLKNEIYILNTEILNLKDQNNILNSNIKSLNNKLF